MSLFGSQVVQNQTDWSRRENRAWNWHRCWRSASPVLPVNIHYPPSPHFKMPPAYPPPRSLRSARLVSATHRSMGTVTAQGGHCNALWWPPFLSGCHRHAWCDTLGQFKWLATVQMDNLKLRWKLVTELQAYPLLSLKERIHSLWWEQTIPNTEKNEGLKSACNNKREESNAMHVCLSTDRN